MPRWIVLLVLVLAALAAFYYLRSEPETRHRRADRIDAMLARSDGTADAAARGALAATLDLSDPLPRDQLRAGRILEFNLGNLAAATELRRNAITAMDERTMWDAEYAHAMAMGHLGEGGENWAEMLPGAAYLLDQTLDMLPDETLRDMQGHINGLHGAARSARREVAIQAAETPGERAAVSLELAQHHTNDPENSHDTAVNSAVRATVQRLRSYGGRTPSLAAVRAEIERGSPEFTADPATGRPRPQLLTRALRTLDRVRAGESYMPAGATDEEVLTRVWARAGAPANRGNEKKIKQAVFDALVDATAPSRDGLSYHTKCVGGRVGRLVGALTLLDADPLNSQMDTLESHKNAIFDGAKKVIREAAETAARQRDPELQRVGRAFLATTLAELNAIGEVDEDTDLMFKDATREKVARFVEERVRLVNEAAPGTLSEATAAGLKADAVAALD